MPAAARARASQPGGRWWQGAGRRVSRVRRSSHGQLRGLLGLLGLLGGGEVEAAGVRDGERGGSARSTVGTDPASATGLTGLRQAPLAPDTQSIGLPLCDGGLAGCSRAGR